jgi:hypothetical protein
VGRLEARPLDLPEPLWTLVASVGCWLVTAESQTISVLSRGADDGGADCSCLGYRERERVLRGSDVG